MFVVIWQFEVTEENQRGFEAAYGPEGEWAQLFRSSPITVGPNCCATPMFRTYVTIDRWASEDAFRAFRKEHDAGLREDGPSLRRAHRQETRIGAYTA